MDNKPTLLSNDLNVITAEINSYKREAGQAIYEIGIRQLGEQASLKQIANHVAPQLELTPTDAMTMLLYAKVRT
ncbi:hypothetical protein [Paenibacillus sp. QZ-Y1]|uniref:hypothetical protein n=1 Tax=Paenibacillus sp. QZ-Y1 TaxID=3414511 RepID=UPI003F7B00F0